MRLTERTIRQIQPPESGYSIHWDDELAGLGVRTTAKGAKAFVWNYRTAERRQRRVTLGRWPAISATAARVRAQEWAAKVHLGSDPLKARDERRAEVTVERPGGIR